MILKLPTAIASSVVLLIALTASAAAQQKRHTPARPQPPPAPTPAPTPPPTIDTLLAADTYHIYGEVRSVGQLIKSNSVNEILEPIIQLAGPPKEFRTVVKWLNTHADEVMSSRMIFAASASGTEVPAALVAIEFASPEEATKFQQQLNAFLQKMIPPATPNAAGQANKDEAPAPPPYHMQQAGSLILITPTPLKLQKLRPAGSKLLAEDVNFRVARNRLNTESIFLFFDLAGMERGEAERIKKAEEEYEKTAAAEKAAHPEAAESPKVELKTEPEETETPIPEEEPMYSTQTRVEPAGSVQEPIPVVSAPPIFSVLSMLMSSISSVEGKWPAAIGVALSLENESFDVRALLVSAPGEKSDSVPFLPVLASGPTITPEAPNILPADTEMLVMMSLDLPLIYTALSTPPPTFVKGGPEMKVEEVGETEAPLASLEKQLKINIKDDLLPLLGSEVVVSVPMTGMDWFQPPKAAPPATSAGPAEPKAESTPSPSPSPSPSSSVNVVGTAEDQPKPGQSIAIAIALKDREGMRTLLPKIIESIAFKGAASLAQTERREDTELVSYAGVLSYAFIGNFLVISPDVATTRHIVDSYLKRETLAGEAHFKNYTRWQPRQAQGQVYISPSLMENYRKWIQEPTAPVDEQTRAFLTRFSIVAQPVTYSLSNEGFGPMHELHVPKNLVLLLIAASAGSIGNPPPQPATPAEAPASTPPVTPPPGRPARPSNPY